MIFAIDFDGTLCEDDFPCIGKEIPGRIEKLKKLQKKGHKLILWTCRQNDEHGAHLNNAVKWCADRGLVFDAVNENLPEVQKKWGGDTRKVYCDYYIDDRGREDYWLDHLNI